jgi:divalent metal cation (Fe/Co/Zn/Cd) transporter
MWLLRNNPIGPYISPVVSVFVAVYLMVGCIKRIKTSLNELTDKTLPEEEQLKILRALTQYYNCYSQVYSIDSRKIGEITRIDISLSFENNTRAEEIVAFQTQMQEELGKQIDNCVINIIIHNK